MSDPSTLEEELFEESPGVVFEGTVINGGTSETAWQPQAAPTPSSPRSARTAHPRIVRWPLKSPKLPKRAPRAPRTASAPTVPAGPRKSVVMGRRLVGASRQGVLSYSQFLDAAILRLDKVASACTTVMLIAAFAAYLAYRPSLEQIAVGLACGIAMLAMLLLPLVHRLYAWRERGTFLSTMGVVLIGLTLLAIVYAVARYTPQYVSGMAAIAAPVMMYADYAGKKLQQRKAAEREAAYQAEITAVADERERTVRAEIQPLLDQVQSIVHETNAQLATSTGWMQQLVVVAPQLQEMAQISQDILVGLKVKHSEVEAAINGRVEQAREAYSREWTETAKSHFAQHTQTQVDQAVAANQQQNDGTIMLRNQEIAELGGQVQQLRAALEQAQQAQQSFEQQLAEAQAANRELAEENNRLQRDE